MVRYNVMKSRRKCSPKLYFNVPRQFRDLHRSDERDFRLARVAGVGVCLVDPGRADLSGQLEDDLGALEVLHLH